MDKITRIGGGASYFIDSPLYVPQLIAAGVDYIILDYLAEGAMGLFGRMRAADPAGGFPPDFLQVHIGPHLDRIANGGPKIIANAGAVNPAGLVAAIRAEIAQRGLSLTVACVSGDDLLPQLADFAGVPDMDGGAALPATGATSFNAYLGAFPIAEALSRGADIVITGRVADSAMALGALVHEFGWGKEDWDLLAAGTLAGHLVECSGQITGGTYTDWETVEGFSVLGAPIAECSADGTLCITKPEDTGGCVTRGTVGEQMLYETSDPHAYIVPDVVLDMANVTLEEVGQDRVRVTGAVGHPATATLKACATIDDGWRATAYQPMVGANAVGRARKQAAMLFERGNILLRGRNLPPFRQTEAVLIGAGEATGNIDEDATEIVLKLVADHDDQIGAQMFLREQFQAMSGGMPGNSIAFGVGVAPQMRLVSVLLPKNKVQPMVDMGEGSEPAGLTHSAGFDREAIVRAEVPECTDLGKATKPLSELAWLRSGEKGETINIGIVARNAEDLPAIAAALSPEALGARLAHLFSDGEPKLSIHYLPGPPALNIVLHGALPGGINASTRMDPAAKSVAQQMIDMPVRLPAR